MQYTIKSSTMPEFTRVVEFELEGESYWAEIILTKYSLEFYVSKDNQRLTNEQTWKLFGSNANDFNEVLDDFIEKVEDLEADAIISWREKVSA